MGGTSFFPDRARSAMAVSSRCGDRGAPYTTPFPAFQPPLGQARSISISIPSFTRCGVCPRSPQLQGTWFRARIAKPVGTTQLTVSGNQGQPYLSGSKRTRRAVVRNFQIPGNPPRELCAKAKAASCRYSWPAAACGLVRRGSDQQIGSFHCEDNLHIRSGRAPVACRADVLALPRPRRISLPNGGNIRPQPGPVMGGC